MRTVFFLLFMLVNNGPANAYSCLPPDLGHEGCIPKYFTLPQMEDTIHGMKGVTERGKSFIYKELLKKRKTAYFKLNLRIFSEELCQKSGEQGMDLFNSGYCHAELLSYSLNPYGEIEKIEGHLDIEINIGPDGRPNGGAIRGGVKF